MQNTCLEEKLDEIFARLETSPRKSVVWHTAKCTSASSPQNATKLLHLHPYRTAVVHKLHNTVFGQKLFLRTGPIRECLLKSFIPHLFCSVKKVCFIYVDMWTVRIMFEVCIIFHVNSQCHYMILVFMCSVLCMQPELLSPCLWPYIRINM